MTDYTELVKSLRHCAIDRNCQACEYDTTLHCADHLKADAAAAIEALQYEIRESMQKCAECGENEPNLGEIVRCRECKHYNAGFECLMEGYGIERDPDWFCADGERKVQE